MSAAPAVRCQVGAECAACPAVLQPDEGEAWAQAHAGEGVRAEQRLDQQPNRDDDEALRYYKSALQVGTRHASPIKYGVIMMNIGRFWRNTSHAEQGEEKEEKAAQKQRMRKRWAAI
jgi:hypothetical protein